MAKERQDELFFNLIHASRNFPTGKVRLFGQYLVHDENSSSLVYSRADLIFFKDVASFGYQGLKLGTLESPYSCKYNVENEDILAVETNLTTAEAKLVNPYSNSKTHDIFHVSKGHLASLHKEEGNLKGIELEDAGYAFIEFYKLLLERKDELSEDTTFIKLRSTMRKLEKRVRGAKTPEVWEKRYGELSTTKKKVLIRLLIP